MKDFQEWQVAILVKKSQFTLKKPQDVLRYLKFMGFMSFLAILMGLGLLVVFWAPPFSVTPNQRLDWETSLPLNTIVKGSGSLPLEIAILISKIKEARMVAEKANVNRRSFSEQDRVTWHKANPCISRREIWPVYNERRHSEILEMHPYLEVVLVEYSKFHRACMQNVGGDIVGFFMRKDNSCGCKFVLGDNEDGTGLGNKVLSTASAVIYAMLTQRVLLVPMSTSIPGIMCEPFEGSSWKISTYGIITPAKLHREYWHSVTEVNNAVDGLHLGQSNVTSLYAARVNENWDCQPQKRFFCDAEQEFYETHVTWMYLSECLYYLPKLFAVPRFRPTLEALFPDRMVLTHLLRTVMLPADPVWLRLQQMNHVHFKHVDHRIGIQERYFHGKDDYDLLHEATEKAIAQCLLENHLLPNTSLSNTLNGEAPAGVDEWKVQQEVSPPKTFLVFITSLYDTLKDQMTKIYVRNPSRLRDAVGIIQLTHEDQQQFGVEVDRQALAEVLGLSLNDELIVTPQSTFGAIAAGYGGLVPWFIDIRPDTSTGCVRGITVDACYQLPSSKHYTCPHAPNLDGMLIADMVPYIRNCHSIETPYFKVHGAGLGFQLMTTHGDQMRLSNVD